jgi:3-hydroxybutyryl-CoA dehydrogenase
MSDVTRVGIVGGGQMGAGIAEVCARAGLDVVVTEVDEAAAEAGRGRLTASLDRAVDAGKIATADRDGALGRVSFATDLGEHADRQLVIEAVVEDEQAKLDVFRRLDKVVEAPDAVLASNTSSLPIARLAAATARPGQVIGIHFFNPVPVLRLVELVPSLLTSPETTATAERFARETLGKVVIRSRDRAGFVVNALLIPYVLAAIRMVESSFATAEEIDAGMVEGCKHPLGPLRLADLIGLDTVKAIADSLHDEFKEPQYAPPPLLLRMVEAGRLGRKSGRGFYDHGR